MISSKSMRFNDFLESWQIDQFKTLVLCPGSCDVNLDSHKMGNWRGGNKKARDRSPGLVALFEWVGG